MKFTAKGFFLLLTGLFFSSLSMAQSSVGFNEASELINKGYFMQALVKIDSILAKSQDNAMVYSMQGTAKASLGDCKGAIEAWDTYARLDKENSWKINALKANCYAAQGDHEDAIEVLSKYIVHDPYHGQSYMTRGSEYYLVSKYALAIQDFTTIISRKLEGYLNFEVYYKRGLAYLEFGMEAESLSDFNKVIELYPQFSYGYFYRASVHWNSGKTALAIADFTKAIELDNKDLHSIFNRGMCYKGNNQFDLAITDFSKVIQLDPNFDEAYNQAAMCLFYKGSFQAAEQSFNDYIGKFSNYSHAYFNRGMFYAERLNNDKALEDFDHCLQLNPKDGDAHFHKALILLERKNAPEACVSLEKAVYYGNPDAGLLRKRYCATDPKQ